MVRVGLGPRGETLDAPTLINNPDLHPHPHCNNANSNFVPPPCTDLFSVVMCFKGSTSTATQTRRESDIQAVPTHAVRGRVGVRIRIMVRVKLGQVQLLHSQSFIAQYYWRIFYF